MSEFINTCDTERDLRWRLLTTVSALALATSVCVSRDAKAEDTDRPTVWIELGGQFEQQSGQDSVFTPSFIASNPVAPAFQGFDLQAQKPSVFSNGIEGKVIFEPQDTNWVFSAAILYGRANGSKNIDHRTAGGRVFHTKTVFKTYGPPTPSGYHPKHFHCCVTYTHTTNNPAAFANMQARSRQSHAIIDFQAGRDVGVGLFGQGGSSVVSAGVRVAQFISKSDAAIHAVPSIEFQKNVQQTVGYTVTRYYKLPVHHYAASVDAARSFHGIGPAISWNGSAPLLGNPQAGEINFDWGANAAILFGRQKVAVHRQTYRYYRAGGNYGTHEFQSANSARGHAVTIPNFGGLAAVSFRYANAKISFGYRGDFFFGALDTGVDAAKRTTLGFYGPFAALSVGIGG